MPTIQTQHRDLQYAQGMYIWCKIFQYGIAFSGITNRINKCLGLPLGHYTFQPDFDKDLISTIEN